MLNVGCSSAEPSRRGKFQCLSKTENKTPHLVIRRPVDTTSYDKALKQPGEETHERTLKILVQEPFKYIRSYVFRVY